MNGNLKIRLPVKNVQQTVNKARELGLHLQFLYMKRGRWEFPGIDPGYEMIITNNFPFENPLYQDCIMEIEISGEFSLIAHLLS